MMLARWLADTKPSGYHARFTSESTAGLQPPGTAVQCTLCRHRSTERTTQATCMHSRKEKATHRCLWSLWRDVGHDDMQNLRCALADWVGCIELLARANDAHILAGWQVPLLLDLRPEPNPLACMTGARTHVHAQHVADAAMNMAHAARNFPLCSFAACKSCIRAREHDCSEGIGPRP